MATYPGTTVSNVTFYSQILSDDCAATCLCMCMNVSPTTAYNAYRDYYASARGVVWSSLASVYGYSWSDLATANLTDIYNLLTQNIPVIVEINNSSDNPHWVVIVGSATTNTLTNSSFMCLDPAKTSTPVRVTDAVRYAGIYRYGYVTKN